MLVYAYKQNINKMRKNHLMITAALLVSGLAACNSSENAAAKQDATNLTLYVDSVENVPRVYTTENWTAIDNGYQERAMKAEQSLATLEAADKAKAEESKKKYAALRESYQAKLKENEEAKAKVTVTTNTPDNRRVLRNRLFGEGKMGEDMKFGFVNANNILDVYKNFVQTVSDNRDSYSREDWDEIEVLYEALDTRKNTVEKEGLKGSDNIKIAGQKVKFVAIKATNRGGTKVKENDAAKQ